MKKVFLNALFIIFTVLVTALSTISIIYAFSDYKETDESFEIIGKGTGYSVIKHNKTGVYYLKYSKGVTVMLNADGTPYMGE